MVDRGYPEYRAGQLLDWLSVAGLNRLSRCQTSPGYCGSSLLADWAVFGTQVAYHDVAPDGTEKLVLDAAMADRSSAC